MQKYFYTLFITFFLHQTLTAQTLYGNRAEKYIPNAEIVHINPETGQVDYVQFKGGGAVAVADFENWLFKTFEWDENRSLEIVESETDRLGMTHLKYQQYQCGFEMEGGVLVAHVKNGWVESWNGLIVGGKNLSAVPILKKNKAIDLATSHVAADLYKWQIPSENHHLQKTKNDQHVSYYPQPELVYVPKDFDLKKGDFRLAYKMDIYAAQPLQRLEVYVDAITGEIVAKNNRLCTIDVPATAETRYSGTRSMTTDNTDGIFSLKESGRNIFTYNTMQEEQFSVATLFTDNDNYWNNVNAAQDEVASDVHWGMEQTYDYFLETHGRNSFDGLGIAIRSYVHYAEAFNNAFWDGDHLAFGDGDGEIYNPFTTLDICAHEFTHGLTQFTADLIYFGETGGLNESFSDILGTAVEFEAKPTEADFLIGKSMTIDGTALRNMGNPKSKSMPDTYQGEFWENDNVHFRSGVQNYWFYLLANGGNGVNDFGDSYAVTGIGVEKATAITYRNLSVYLTPFSKYNDARFFSILAAQDLYGACSNEVEQVTNAWAAVGLGEAFDPSVVSEFTASGTVFCELPATVQFSSNSLNAEGYLWNFGDGQTSNEANPSHTFLENGNFTVTLTTFGGCLGDNDVAVKNDFIKIEEGGTFCTQTLFAQTGKTVVTTCEGLLYDDGGAMEDYANNIKSSITIQPSNADFIEVSFNVFALEAGFDFLHIYDGNSADAPLIGSYTGTTLGGMTISSSGGAITLELETDNAIDAPGFEATWQCFLITEPPVAQFVTDNILSCSGSVAFFDISENAPSEWLWNFGDGTVSNLQNPQHIFTENGNYTVSLTVCNDFGCDEITSVNVVMVEYNAVPCDWIEMPFQNTETVATCSGILRDSGGENDYQNNNYSTIHLSRSDAANVLLTFAQFDFATGDQVEIYDGGNVFAPLIGTFSGTALPNDGLAIQSSGNILTILEKTGFGTNGSGFEAQFQFNLNSDALTANFNVSNFNPLFNSPVQFTNLSSENAMNFEWNFGDGGQSFEKNPTHHFTQSGNLTVTLTISNCLGAATFNQNITVQAAPSAIMDTDPITKTLNAGETTSETLFLNNWGSGALDYRFEVAQFVAFDASSTVFYSETGATTVHTFDEVKAADSLWIEVILNGDFNGSSELASLWVEGNFVTNIADGNLANGLDIQKRFGFAESEFIVWIADGDLEVEIRNAASVDVDFDAQNRHQVRVLGSGEQWLSANPSAGLLNGSDAQNLQITFDATNLTAGIYQTDLQFISNDLSDPTLLIPCELTVLGNPAINTFPSAINFGQVMVGTSESRTLQLSNTGTDTLFIASITPSNAAFSTSVNSLQLAPAAFQEIEVYFAPNLVNSFTENLTILSNIGFANIPLNGTGIGAPNIDVNPVEITLDLLTGEAKTETMTILNNGLGDLNYSLFIQNLEGVNQTIEMVYESSGASFSHGFTDINANHLLQIVVTLNGDFDSANEYATLLIDGDLIGEIEDGDQPIGTHIEVVYTFERTEFEGWISDGQITVEIINSEDVDTDQNGENSHTIQVISDLPHWLHFSKNAATISPSNSDLINLVFETENVAGGTYNFEIIAQHNDPLQPPVIIPVHFTILANPVTDFTASATQNCNGIVQFTDVSLNEPTSWAWDFGDGNTSNLQNPTHTYASNGNYTVSLNTCNTLDCDTKTKNNLITVGINSGLCDTTIIGTSGTEILTNCGGIIFDDGGPDGDYGNNVNTTIIIQPPDAETVTITIIDFWLESCCALFSIYDGDSEAAPEIAVFSGFSLPLGNEFTSTGGAMTLHFNALGGTPRPGFEIAYTYTGSSDAPSADFAISNPNPAFNLPIQMMDNSSQAIDYFWDFGDGNVSFETQPEHLYETPGTYTVKLFVSNCFGNDFLEKMVTVQAFPHIEVSPESFNETLFSGDNLFKNLVITNTGNGTLTYALSTSRFLGTAQNSEQFFTTENATTQHIFNGITAQDSLFIEVFLNGDFNSSAEFASLYIEGIFIAEINDQNIENGTETSQRFSFPAASFNNWLEDGELVIEIANSFSVSVGQGGENLHKVQVQADVFPWLQIASNVGTVNGSSSENLQVLIDAEGLYGGEYEAEIVVHSNDIEQPNITIPVHLTVMGTPEINISTSSLNFGQVIQGQSSTQSLLIANTGVANLVVSDLIAPDPAYSFDVTNFELAPNQTKTINITFSPSTTGFYTGFFSILNNDSDKTVNLWGEGVSEENPQPIINISSDSLCINVPSNTIITENINIENLGEGNLIYTATVNNPPEYENDNTLEYNGFAAITSHTFESITPSDLLKIKVTLNGDFNNANEIATLYVEGELIGQIEDNNVANGTDIEQEFVFEVAEFEDWLTDEILFIEVKNSFTVNTTQGGLNTHTVAVRTESLSWLSNTPVNGIVPALGTTILNAEFDATDLSPGNYSSEILVMSNDLLQPEISIPCKLTVMGVPEVSHSPTSIDFGEVTIGNAKTDSVAITNIGSGILEISNAFLTEMVFSPSPTNLVIQAGQTKKIGITFSPLVVGEVSDVLTVVSNAGTVTINVNGTGSETPQAILNISETAYDFGEVFIGSPAIHTFTISNAGNALLEVNAIFSDEMAFTATPNNFTLAPSEIQVITLTFNPLQVGNYSGSLNIVSNAGTGTISLTGIAQDVVIPTPTILVLESEYVVNLNWGTNTTEVLHISNNGTADLSFDIVLEATDLATALTIPLSSATLNPTQNAVLNLIFNGSVLAPGTYTGNLVILSNDPVFNEIILPITVNILGTPNIQVSASSFDFGEVFLASNASETLTISNVGSAPLVINNIIADDPVFATDLNSFELLPSEAQNIVVTFTPTETIDYSSILNIFTNDENVVINLGGTGKEVVLPTPVINVSNNPISITLEAGDSVMESVALSNVGTADLTFAANIEGVQILDFVTINPENGVLMPDENVGLNLLANGQDVVAGTYIGNLSITSNDPDNSLISIAIIITINGTPEAILSNNLLDFETVIVGETATQTITISNTGTALLNVSNIIIPLPDFLVSTATFDIEPGNFQNIDISFTPFTTAPYNNFLTVVSNAGNFAINVIGEGIAPPVAIFEIDDSEVCDGTIQFNDISENAPDSYFWDFGDDIGVSTETSPSYTYTLPGSYNVQLITTNNAGTDTSEVTIEVPFVLAGFEVPDTVVVGETFVVSDLSMGSDNWLYGMGDGALYNEATPVHSYATAGTFQILQSVESSAGCIDVVNQTIVVLMNVGIEDIANDGQLEVFPNPVRGTLFIQMGNFGEQNTAIELYNILGKRVLEMKDEKKKTIEIDVSTLVEGVYFLKIVFGTKSFTKEIVIQK